MNNDLLIFAAKWEDGYNKYHPLVYHLIDSGVTARALWNIGLSEGGKKQISHWLGLPFPEIAQLLAFWVSLHDIGKATPSFQIRCAPARAQLEGLGLEFPNLHESNIRHHSLLSAWILEQKIEKLAVQPIYLAKRFLLTIAGHHGFYPSFGEFNESTYRAVNIGNSSWQQMQTELIALLEDIFPHPKEVILRGDCTIANAFLSVFTGFLITTDWIASNTALFAYHPPNISAKEYYQKVERVASDKVRQIGWEDWLPKLPHEPVFKDIFPGFKMNSIQQEVSQRTSSLDDPFLLILEAPTGSGKTEAALYVADYWIMKRQLRGLYVAMPTQATSNQMYRRVARYLQKSLPKSKLRPILVHGNALIHQQGFTDSIRAVSDDEKETILGEINAMTWFTPRKRTLLAPFGVGTVDQAFLSVLRARHFPLRLFGLFRKVVIFDEVHAYDVYMVEIFKRLLAWLRSMGSSAILLSATLPSQTREELLKAFNPTSTVKSLSSDFPRLSINCNSEINVFSIGKVESRKVLLEYTANDDQSILLALKERLGSGGCAAVICNTVDRAQRIFQTIRASGFWDSNDLILLHSRFPYCWREQLEKKVLSRFGKLSKPMDQPRRGIVVATQIIEQSLDLDFDLLVTDLAPVDLLIQRIGRLQRHQHQTHPPRRPAALQCPACIITIPPLDQRSMPSFGADRFVYDEIFLQRTYFVIRSRNCLHLPEDSDTLIEQVYSNSELPSLDNEQKKRLGNLYRKMVKAHNTKAINAENRLLSDVDGLDMFRAQNAGIEFSDEDENLNIHQDLRALTRSAQPTVNLICLLRNGESLKTLDRLVDVDMKHVPLASTLEAALRSAVKISHFSIVKHFMNQVVPSSWKKSPYLRHAYPLEFKDGICDLRPGLSLRLDKELGVIVQLCEANRMGGGNFMD